MKKIIQANVAVSTLMLSMLTSTAFAHSTNHEEITALAVVTKSSTTNQANVNHPTTKKVYLTKPHFMEKQAHKLFSYNFAKNDSINDAKLSYILGNKNAKALPSQVSINMTVPVLDQGAHDTSATFANTAALDQLMGKGDHISQLCNLEFAAYLETFNSPNAMPGYFCGWEGTDSPTVLNQIFNFGFVNKIVQHEQSCAGLSYYPKNNPENMGNIMPIDEFSLKREDVQNSDGESFYVWFPLLDWRQSMMLDYVYPGTFDGNKIFTEVKRVLATHQVTIPDDGTYNLHPLVTFGALLPVKSCKDKLGAGACAKYHADHDTWAITSEIAKVTFDDYLGTQEMIITGYDDNAVVTDEDGVQHTGIFMLRNSWGADVGDNGNFYMTYDFFKKFVYEAQLLLKGKWVE